MNTSKHRKSCDSIMDEFLALDKNEKLPLRITAHLLTCQNCRTEVRLLTLAEKVAARNTASPELSRFSRENPLTLTKWVVCGIVMIVFSLCFLIFAGSLHSDALMLAFALMFAFMVSAYCALFVGVNLDFFVKKIENFESRHTV